MRAFGECGIVRQNTAVIDSAIAQSNACDGTHIFCITLDGYILQCDVLHHATIDGVEERVLEVCNELCATIERAAEGLDDGGGTAEVERFGGGHLIM